MCLQCITVQLGALWMMCQTQPNIHALPYCNYHPIKAEAYVNVLNFVLKYHCSHHPQTQYTIISCSTSSRRKLPKLGQTCPHHLSLFTVSLFSLFCFCTHSIFLQLTFHISSVAILYFFSCHFIFLQLAFYISACGKTG